MDAGGTPLHMGCHRQVCVKGLVDHSSTWVNWEAVLRGLTLPHVLHYRCFGLTEKIYCAIIKVALSRIILEGSSLKVAGSLWQGIRFFTA